MKRIAMSLTFVLVFTSATFAQYGTYTAAEIIGNQERAKAQIDSMKAQEFTSAVNSVCTFIDRNMSMLNSFVNSTILKRDGRNPHTVTDLDVNLLNSQVAIIQDSVAALQQKLSEDLPVKNEDSYRPSITETTSKIAGIGAGIAADRTNKQVLRDVSNGSRHVAYEAEQARVQKEQNDRYAGINVLSRSSHTLANVQSQTEKMANSVHTQTANPEKVLKIFQNLAAQFSSTSINVNQRLSDVQRPRKY